MEAKRSDIAGHATDIARVLASLIGIKLLAPLVRTYEVAGEFIVTIAQGVPHLGLPDRKVTTDLGQIETVVGLPIPEASRPKFWIGLHESWVFLNKRKVGFKNCGIRVYVGAADEDSRQFLRLEWVAPELAKDGSEVYQGGHAAHPHWHIDRAALVGPEEHLRSLEMLTTSMEEAAEVLPFDAIRLEVPRLVQDLSWLGGVHLPAQTEWMHYLWDGVVLPAPHQSAPQELEMLKLWWEGSLRYLFAELSQNATI